MRLPVLKGLPISKKKYSNLNSNEHLVIHLTSNSVNGLIYSFNDSLKEFVVLGLDRVVYTENLLDLLAWGGFEDHKDILGSLLDKLRAISESLPKNPVVGIPLKNTFSKMITVRYKRKEPRKKISGKEMEQILDNILQKAKIDVKSEFSNVLQGWDDSPEVLQYTLPFTKIDGYITKDLENQRGSIVEVSLHIIYAPSNYLKNLFRYFELLKLKPKALVPNIYAFSKVLPKFVNDENYIIVNLDAFLTEVGIVFGNELVATTSFNLGYKDFLLFISNNQVLNNSESHILPDKKKAEIDLKEIQDFWADCLFEKLSSVANIKILPNKIFFLKKQKENISVESLFTSLEKLNFKAPPVVESLNISFEELGVVDLKSSFSKTLDKVFIPLSLMLASKDLFKLK